MTVACVLRSGGIYTPEWVQKLGRATLRRAVSPRALGTRFVCLSDMPVMGVERIDLAHDFPGWWAKLCLFEPGLFHGPVFYLDLDTLPVGDLSELANYAGPFAMLSDFYQPTQAESGVMAWTPGPETEAIWEAFVRDPFQNMKRFRRDGRFIAAHSNPARLQVAFPGQICSLKVHARKGPPAGARLVCAHGNPRFSDPAAGWAHDAWRAA